MLTLIGLFLRTLRALADALPADHGWSLPLVLSLTGGLLGAAGVEACKMAAVRWICLRRWEDWAPLGIAFGAFKAIGVLVSWTLDKLSFGPLVAFSAILFVAAARALLLHFALGRLAAGAARCPGSPWLAFGLAACAHATFANGWTALLLVSPTVHMRLVDYDSFLFSSALVGFALVIWRWVPWPVEPSAPGPARELLAGAAALIFALAAVVPVCEALLTTHWRAQLPTALFWAVGASFVALLFAKRVVQPWVEDGRKLGAGQSRADRA